MNRVVVSCLMLIVSMAARSDEPLRESVCAFTVTAPEGGFRIVPSKTLEVLHQVVSTDVFTLPADAPQHVASVMCARSSPIPVLNDMAVVKAGYPLFITAPATSGPPRVFALESDQSVYRLRAIRGQLAPAEQTAVEAIQR
jgi:hypothetical protein